MADKKKPVASATDDSAKKETKPERRKDSAPAPSPEPAPGGDHFRVPEGMALADHFLNHGVITQQHHEACQQMLPEEAIQKVTASQSGKQYDATGYGYQYIADRLSNVFGPAGWTEEHESIETKGTWGKRQTTNYHITCKMTLKVGRWVRQDVDGIGPVSAFIVSGQWAQYGEHTSGNRGDARKGAHGNAMKKVAALGLGIGASAFRGTIDEDMAGERPPDDARGRQQRPPISPAQAAAREKTPEPEFRKSTRDGTCILGGHQILPGQWVAWPVLNPWNDRRGAACQVCFDQEFPQYPDRPWASPAGSPQGTDSGGGQANGPDDGQQPGDAQGAPTGGVVDDPDDDLPF